MVGKRLGALLAVWVVVTMQNGLIAQERQPFIINGEITDAFPAVGIVGQEDRGGFCTGTLIGPNHVLTAAHCAEALLDAGPEDTGTFELGNRTYRTSRVEIISSYNSRQFTNDVAILVLADSVTDVEPVPLSDFPPDVGEVVLVVGFGGAGTAESGSDGTFGIKRVGTATVDAVTDTEFSWNFDDPSESNAAPGDSGGPVFIDTGESVLLAGIVSSGTTDGAGLGDINFNMRVDAYEGFITDTVDATTVIDEGPSGEPPAEEEEEEEEEEEQGEEPSEEDPTEELPTDEADPSAESGDDTSNSCRPSKPSCRTQDSGCKRPCEQVCDDSSDQVTETVEPPSEPEDAAGEDSSEVAESPSGPNPLRKNQGRRRGSNRQRFRNRPVAGNFDASRYYRYERRSQPVQVVWRNIRR